MFKAGSATNRGSVPHRICHPQHLDMHSKAQRKGKWYGAAIFVFGCWKIATYNCASQNTNLYQLLNTATTTAWRTDEKGYSGEIPTTLPIDQMMTEVATRLWMNGLANTDPTQLVNYC